MVIISNNGEKGCPIAIQRDFELTVAEPSTEVYTPTVTIPTGQALHSYKDLLLLIHSSNYTGGNQHIGYDDDGLADTHIDRHESKIHPQTHYDYHTQTGDDYENGDNWYHPQDSLYRNSSRQDQNPHQNLQLAAPSYPEGQESYCHPDSGHRSRSANHDRSRADA